MKLNETLKSDICRLSKIQKMSVNAIAARLGLHHSTVKKALQEEPEKFSKARAFPRLLAPQRPFIEELLERYPELQGSRLAEILAPYQSVSANTCRRALRILRHKAPKAYGKRTVFPGLEAQVDWAEKMVLIGEKKTKVYLFVMVLAYSRHMYVEITQDMTAETFMWCHARAFEFFRSVPQAILYDNLKAVVIERWGDAIRFSDSFMAFSRYYLFDPRACHVRTPQEKGRVERQVSVVKNNFFNARQFEDLQDAKNQLTSWLQERLKKPHPENRQKIIADFFAEESPHLLALPATPFYPRKIIIAKIGKQPYVRFETNWYSIPPEYVCTTLRVGVGPEDLMIYKENQLITSHVRCFKRYQCLERKEHLNSLLRTRQPSTAAVYLRGYLLHRLPDLQAFFQLLAARQEKLGPVVKRLETLMDQYGLETLEQAVQKNPKFSSLNELELVLMSFPPKSDKDFKQQVRKGLPSHLKQITTKHHPLTSYKE